MFIAIQFPFTDARPFLHTDHLILPFPVWSLPKPNVEFVRSFGVIKKRRLGGIDNWSNEEMYCRVMQAIKLKPSIPMGETSLASKVSSKQRCAFRRLIADGRFREAGNIVVRLELGFVLKGNNYEKYGLSTNLHAKEFLTLLHAVLGQQVTVRNKGEIYSCAISETDKYIARDYLQRSTRQVKKESLGIKDWWFTSGTPLLVVEYEVGTDILELPKYVRYVQSDTLTSSNISASYMNVEFDGKEIGVWILGVKRLETDRKLLRNLRLNLFRLHAEIESIKQVFRLIVQKNIIISRNTEPTERLQRYLTDSIKLLSKETRYGVPQSVFLDIAQQGHDIISLGERGTLLYQLNDIRGQLLGSIKDFLETKEPFREPIYGISHVENVTIITNGGKYVGQELNISNSTVGDINQVAAESINNSFNKVAKSEVSDELKNKFKELSEQVAEMLKSLPEEKHDDVTHNLEVLAKEATKKEPRKEWYELSANGLIEAANTVGEMAKPVIATIKAILPLLALAV